MKHAGTMPWWLRPLRAVLVGVGVGLGLTWSISLLPETGQLWAYLVLAVAAFVFVLWQMWDLRRLNRNMEAKLEEWRRANPDWPVCD